MSGGSRNCGDLEFQSRSVSGKWGVRHTPLPKPPSHGNHSGKMEEMDGGHTEDAIVVCGLGFPVPDALLDVRVAQMGL